MLTNVHRTCTLVVCMHAGSRLRRNVLADGSVAPVADSEKAAQAAVAVMGGMEEKFAFQRAVSRLYEMQSPLFGRRTL